MRNLLVLCAFLILGSTSGFANPKFKSNNGNPNLSEQSQALFKDHVSGFEENLGQVSGDYASEVKYFSQIGDLSVFLLDDAIVYQFHKTEFPEGYNPSNAYRTEEENRKHEELRKKIKHETYRMDVQLVGANPNARISTDGKSDDYVNYYNKNLLEVYKYSKVTYHDVYPQIDWVIYNQNGQLKYDFVVRPGGDPKRIKLKTKHVDHPKLNSKGGLELANILGTVSEDKPVSFQNNAPIQTQFMLSGNEISFEIPAYDPSQTLIIDPVIRIWGTYYGGTNGGSFNYSYATATDASGSVYITGETTGSISMVAGGYQTTYGGGARDAFLHKFNSCGSRVWTTYFGGAVNELGRALAVDATGNVYMAGYTNSTTAIAGGGHQNTFGGGNWDAFLAKFNSSGVRQWSTYYGGTSWDYGYGCAVDGSGNVFLVGHTNSPNGTGAIANGSHQNVLGGNDDGFVVKFNSAGVRQWGAYYGGAQNDFAYSCRADASGNVYIAGATGSTTAISTVGSHQAALSGNFDGFVAKFNGTGTRQWGTYYGGPSADRAYGCTLDGSANVYIAGETNSLSGIALNGHQNTYSAGQDGFLVKFNTSGVREWGTYYGDAGNDVVWNCMTNSTGDVFMTGQTTSGSNIASLDGYQTTAGGGTDAFLIKFNTSGVRQWGTYYGGAGEDQGYDCARDNSNNIFITGATNSTTNIAFAGFQNTVLAGPGYFDAFLAKLNETCAAAVVPAVSISSNFTVICAGSSVTFTATPANGGGSPTYQWKKNGVNVGTNSPTFTTSTIANGDVFTVEMTSSDLCASPCAPITSNSITITVNPVPTTPTAPSVQNFCLSGTVSQLQATGSNIQWYSVGVGGTPLAPSTALVAGLYFVSQTVNGCESSRLQVTVNIIVPAAPTGNATQTFCSTATVSELTATGTAIKWYSTPTGGTQLSTNTLLVDGSTYYASQTTTVGALNCEGTNRFAVTVSLTSALCNSLHFDGVNDAVDLPASTHTNIITSGTLEAWIKTTNAGTGFRAVLVRQGRQGLFLNNNQLMSYNYLDNIATTYSGATLNDNQWHHIVLTFQNGVNNGSQLYLDGTAVGAPFYHANGTATANFRIGNTLSNQPYQGQIDNVRLWGRVLTPAEVSASFSCGNPTNTALAGSYNFNQGTAGGTNTTVTTLTDNSGLNNNGTLVNFALTGTTSNWVTGLDCAALACPAPTGNPNQVICNAGTVSNLSATGTNIQWYAAPAGGSPLPSNTPLQNGVTYYASQTTVICESSARLAVTVTINTTPAPTGNATQTFCNSATVANLTATGSSIQWYAAPSGGTALAAGTALTNGSTYYASQTLNSCESATRFAVTVTINTTPAPTGTAAQSFCSPATVANLTATGTSIQWYSVAGGGTALASGTALTNGAIYYATQTLNGCESSSRFAVTATVTTVAAPTGAATQNFCGTPTVANLVATGTNIKWYTTANGGTALVTTTPLTNGAIYYATQTVNSCESANRLAVTVNIYSCENGLHFDGLNDQVALATTINSSITSAGTFEAWIKTTNAGSGFRALIVRPNYYGLFLNGNQLMSYNWTANGSVGATTYTGASLNDNQWHHVALTFREGVANGSQLYLDGQAVGAPFTHFISYVPANFALGANTNTQYYTGLMDRVKIWGRVLTPQEMSDSYNCVAVTGTNLIANYNFNQGFPSQNNAGTTTLIDEAGTADNGTLTGFGLNGATSNWVSGYTCTPNLCPTPTGPASQTYCNGSTVANLVANGTAIQWYAAAAGGTALTPTTLLTNGTTYYATQTVNGCESTNRLAVTVTVNGPAAPTGNAAQTFCNSATVANLTATGTAIQWYAAAAGGTALASGTALTNGTTYYATQTVSGCESFNRFAVSVTINAPAAPTGNAAQTFCNSATVANLVATGTSIQWYSVSAGGTALAAGTALTNGSTYYATQTINSCQSLNRLAVTVTINAPAAPTGTASQSFCNSATVANLAATGTDIRWYAAPSGGTALATGTALTNGTIYYASQSVSNCESINRFAVTVTINTTAAPTGTAAQTFCNSATVANLTATGSGIQWYAAPSGGTALAAGTALTTATTYYATQTLNSCESANRFAVTVTINVTPAPTGSATQTVCSGAVIGDLSATGTGIQWYSGPTGGTALSAGTALVNGSTYYASQTISGCESATRLAVNVVFGIPGAPTGSANQSFCNSGTIGDLSASGSNIRWYATPSGGTALSAGTALVNGTTYYATQTPGTCESVNRLAVTVTINTTAAPTGTAAQTFCNSGTVANLAATGTAIQWYSAPSGGTALAAGTALTNGSTYYATQTLNNCESANRFAVTVTIDAPAAPTGTAAQTFCNAATVANLTATGSSIQWYAAPSGGTALAAGTALTNGTTYYATQTLNNCESASRFAVTVTINAPAAPTGTPSQTFCNAATVANLTATGSSIQWYAAPSGGTALAAGTALTNGSTYYATQTLNNCESANRFAVTVTINAPAAPTGTAAQTFCNAATVADLTASGSGIQWYSASSGGTALAVGTALTDGSTYFASQTLNNCESANRFAVTVTINVTPAPTGTAAQTFCNSATVADLTAIGSGIQWYSASSGGTALAVGTSLTDGSTYFASQTLNNCESGTRLAVVVTINAPAAPSGSSTQIICGSGTLADLVLSGSSVTWFDASSGGNVLSSSTVVSNGSTYHASQTVNGCESLNRLAVTVTINAIPAAPTGNAAQTFCNGATVADLVATGAGLNWYSASTGGTAIPAGTILTDGSSYFASQTVNGCESTDRLEVVVTIDSPAAPTGNTTQSFCSAATVNDLTATGSSIVWYTTATGGTPLAGSTAITTGTYFASQTLNGCESLNRLAVTVTVTILDATVNQSGSTLTAAQSGANYTWLDCNNGNQPIAGATGQSFTPTANGSYAVEINLNGCSVVSACFQVTLVGMEEDKLSLLEIRPNPTHGILMITVSEPTTAVVTAANGLVVAKLTLDGDTLLDASEFAMGIYLIRTAEGKTAKFVKQ